MNLEDREDILKPQPKMEQAIPGQQGQDLPTGTQIIDIFRQRGQGARMLILGQPGAGKSIALWLLARDLLDEAELNLEQPIPVIFLLSTWQAKQSIADWLVQELKEKYSVSEKLGRNWVENERLLLLLDGLDEVRENLQEDCVEAINQFLDKYGSTKAVVCSRINDYDALSKRKRLKFDDAISLKPLEVEQVKQYLNAAGSKMAAVKAVINARPELLEMVTNPLMLSVMTLAYQGIAAQDIPRDLSETDVFNQYVKQMLFRRKPAGYSLLGYKDDTTKHWLIWLAQRMLAASPRSK